MTGGALPVVFISHGSPAVRLDDDDYTRALANFPQTIARPAAIVVVSAHWQAPPPIRVTAAAAPTQLYDFGGFPDALYEFAYAPPGEPALAGRIVGLLRAAGLDALPDGRRGLDHGVWIPLSFAFPRGDVPVVAVSLPLGAAPADLARLGAALAPLREQGVLLIGSGGVVHNLARLAWDDPGAPIESWAAEFDRWVWDRVQRNDLLGLVNYRSAAPHADLAVPTSEHFDPLFVALGAATSDARSVEIYAGFRHGNLSMRSFLRET